VTVTAVDPGVKAVGLPGSLPPVMLSVVPVGGVALSSRLPLTGSVGKVKTVSPLSLMGPAAGGFRVQTRVKMDLFARTARPC
jgi:hypothetical protein